MSTRPAWIKSSYSDLEGDACVEVAIHRCAIRVRDSKDATGPQLTVSSRAWAAFIPFAASGA
ncbi:hypothetical protein ADK70_14140 [Streptomyces rimosus subsp. pseudoverticillatus]|uniref:DUF397 domain-containing protein n=1 Tax=Streptomyces rimosus TaxID=1927 RepID=UPI0006C1666B|nr:DUF397 domain-containing protein [Streptomyces rimosus]KOT93250.1 hypothetical protein ADK70_14140 [Streptomyces rimosus subsp. pseudoverticillatus]